MAAPAAAPAPAPAAALPHLHFTTPLAPSVMRLLMLNNISDPASIPASGKHGMLTKGDVLAFLGKVTLPAPVPVEVAPAPAVAAAEAPVVSRIVCNGCGQPR